MAQNHSNTLVAFRKQLLNQVRLVGGKPIDIAQLAVRDDLITMAACSLARHGNCQRSKRLRLNQVFKVHVRTTSFDEKLMRADIDWVFEECRLKQQITKECRQAYDVLIELKNFDKTSDPKRHGRYGYRSVWQNEALQEIERLGYRPATYSEYLELHAAYPSLRYVKNVSTICLHPHASGFHLFQPHRLTHQNTGLMPSDYVPVVKM